MSSREELGEQLWINVQVSLFAVLNPLKTVLQKSNSIVDTKASKLFNKLLQIMLNRIEKYKCIFLFNFLFYTCIY